MVIPLEVAIGRLTGLLHYQTHQAPLCREAPEALDVCPHCKRQVIPYWNHDGGYVFPGDWQCPEHGSVTPMKSAVVNRHPYVPDWSAAWAWRRGRFGSVSCKTGRSFTSEATGT